MEDHEGLTLEERFADRPVLRDAAASLRTYEAKLAEIAGSGDEAIVDIAESRRPVVQRALVSLETVDAVIVEDPLASTLNQQAQNATASIDTTGVGSPEAAQAHEQLQRTLREIASVPRTPVK